MCLLLPGMLIRHAICSELEWRSRFFSHFTYCKHRHLRYSIHYIYPLICNRVEIFSLHSPEEEAIRGICFSISSFEKQNQALKPINFIWSTKHLVYLQIEDTEVKRKVKYYIYIYIYSMLQHLTPSDPTALLLHQLKRLLFSTSHCLCTLTF